MKRIFSFSKNKQKKELSSAKKLFLGSTLIIISIFLFTSFVSYLFNGDIDQSSLYDFSNKELTNTNFEPGMHKLLFNAENFSQGTYFVRMQADNTMLTNKIDIVK